MRKKLKFITSALLASIFIGGIAFAKQDLTFTWDANTESDLAGYRLYRSATSGNYTIGKGNELAEVPAGTETVKVTQIDPGYFVLTAFDNHGNESDKSVEVESMPPVIPKNIQITVTITIP